MYSIKPGRSQSLFAAFGLAVFVVVTIGMAVMVSGAGAPGFFVLVPVLMSLIGIAGIAFHLYNAFSGSRTSVYDITRGEPDPLDPGGGGSGGSGGVGRGGRASAGPRVGGYQTRHGGAGSGGSGGSGGVGQFCTHCGLRLDAGDRFCGHCGMAVDDG